MLFKLILSIVALLAGVGLMQASVTPKAPQVELDPIRREVRLTRHNPTGPATILQRCSFDLLTRAERRGHFLRFWGQDGELMAETMVSDRDALNSLLCGLRDAGKIA